VDQRDVLVADALDVVLAEAALEERRALEGLDGDDPRPVRVLQGVAGRDRPGRAGRRDEGVEAKPGPLAGERLEDPPEGAPGAQPVDEVVSELAELVEAITGKKAPSVTWPVWMAKIGLPFVKVYCKLIQRRPIYFQTQTSQRNRTAHRSKPPEIASARSLSHHAMRVCGRRAFGR